MLGTNHAAIFSGPGVTSLDWVTGGRERNIVERRDGRVLEVCLERINSSVSQRTRVTQFTASSTGGFDLKIQKRGFVSFNHKEMAAVQRGGGNCLDSTVTYGMYVPNRHSHTIVPKNAQLAQIDEESKRSVGRTWPSEAMGSFGSFGRFAEVSGVRTKGRVCLLLNTQYY